MDSVDPQLVQQVTNELAATPGIQGVDAVRIRWVGHELRAEAEILSAATLTLRQAHDICDDNKDIASASLIENWIDETEERTWFLFEAVRGPDKSGH